LASEAQFLIYVEKLKDPNNSEAALLQFIHEIVIGPCHVSGNFLPFKGKSHSLSSQAALFFSFAKKEKITFALLHGPLFGLINY
jgi:hypothetical protein